MFAIRVILLIFVTLLAPLSLAHSHDEEHAVDEAGVVHTECELCVDAGSSEIAVGIGPFPSQESKQPIALADVCVSRTVCVLKKGRQFTPLPIPYPATSPVLNKVVMLC